MSLSVVFTFNCPHHTSLEYHLIQDIQVSMSSVFRNKQMFSQVSNDYFDTGEAESNNTYPDTIHLYKNLLNLKLFIYTLLQRSYIWNDTLEFLLNYIEERRGYILNWKHQILHFFSSFDISIAYCHSSVCPLNLKLCAIVFNPFVMCPQTLLNFSFFCRRFTNDRQHYLFAWNPMLGQEHIFSFVSFRDSNKRLRPCWCTSFAAFEIFPVLFLVKGRVRFCYSSLSVLPWCGLIQLRR